MNYLTSAHPKINSWHLSFPVLRFDEKHVSSLLRGLGDFLC